MYPRVQEHNRIVSSLRNGVNVVLTSSWGGGRDRLTLQVARALEGLGIETIRVDGFRGSSATPFATLRMWDPSLFHGNPDTGTIADRLVAQHKSSSAVCFVISDFELVDPYSAAVLEVAHRRLGATALLSMGLGTSDALATTLSSWPVEFVTLPALSHTQVAELLQSRVDRPVSTELVSRVYIDSAGNPAIAVALFENGIRSGLITFGEDAWRLSSQNLWGDSLIPLMTAFINGIPPESRWLLQRICIDPAPTADFYRNSLTDEQALLDLKRRGLITELVDSTGAKLLTPIPPTLQRYFRDIAGALDSAVDGSTSPIQNDAIEARELENFRTRRASCTRQKYHSTPSVVTANLHLKSLWSFPSDSLEVAAVFEKVPVSTASSYEEFKNIVFRYQWEAYEKNNFRGARQILSHAPRTDDLRALAKIYDLLLDLHSEGLPDNYLSVVDDCLERIEQSELGTIARTLISYIYTTSGDSQRALNILPSQAPDDHVALWTLAKGLAYLGCGKVATCLSLMTEMQSFCRGIFDVDGIYASAYVTALAQMSIGNWKAAGTALQNVRAMGTPGLLLAPLFKAVIQLSAIVIAEAGKPAFAQSMINPKEDKGDTGPLPGNFKNPADLVDFIAGGESSLLAEELLSSSEHAHLHRYALSASMMALWALSIAPTPAVYARVDKVVCGEMKSLHGKLFKLAESVVLDRNDVSAGALAIPDDCEADIYWAQLMLRQKADAVRHADPALSEHYTLTARTLAVSTGGRVVAASWSGDRDESEVLSSREREVALLAGQLSNAQIAERLGISKRTVDHHVSNALRKTGQRNRSDLHALVSQSSTRI